MTAVYLTQRTMLKLVSHFNGSRNTPQNSRAKSERNNIQRFFMTSIDIFITNIEIFIGQNELSGALYPWLGVTSIVITIIGNTARGDWRSHYTAVERQDQSIISGAHIWVSYFTLWWLGPKSLMSTTITDISLRTWRVAVAVDSAERPWLPAWASASGTGQ